MPRGRDKATLRHPVRSPSPVQGGNVMTSSSRALIERSIPFLAEVRNRTAGPELESWLNRTHGPGSSLWDDLAAMVTDGVESGWAANIEVVGPNYRRSRIAE